MKIKTVKIKNFKGILQEEISFKSNKIATLIGSNGIGKTSFIEALRFGLTGVAPQNPIRDGSDSMTVAIETADGTEFSRTMFRDDRPSRVIVNGRVTPAKNLNNLIQELFGFGTNILKVATSSEVLTSMKSDELGDFLLQYIPEKLDSAKVMSFISDVDEKVQEAVLLVLPKDKFEIEDVNRAYDEFLNVRKIAKKDLEFVNNKLMRLPTIKPPKSLKELQDEWEEVVRKEGAVKAYHEALKLYEMTRKQRESTLKTVEDLQRKFDSFVATRPNPAIRADIEAKLLDVVNRENEAERMIQIMSQTISSLQTAIERLSTNHCPLSDKLVCTTDKTQVKEELVSTLKSNEEGITIHKRNLIILAEEKESFSKALKEYDANATAYNEKIAIGKQLENLKKTIPDVIPAPSVIAEKDYEKEKAILKEQVEYAKQWEEKEKLEKKKVEEEERVKLYDYLCKEFAPKGEIMTKILSSYLSYFEEEINKRATILRAGMRVKFAPENGVKCYIRIRDGREFHLYDDLSAGEKTLVAFLLLDLVSSLCGTRLMILDDLNHLDRHGLDAIFMLMSSAAFLDCYDNIVIASVNTEDIQNVITKYVTVVQAI